MATKIDDGGPAFPVPVAAAADLNGSMHVVDSEDRGVGGMSLRDYFAAKAMSGLIAADLSNDDEGDLEDLIGNYEDAANVAYCYADAMLAARKASASSPAPFPGPDTGRVTLSSRGAAPLVRHALSLLPPPRRLVGGAGGFEDRGAS